MKLLASTLALAALLTACSGTASQNVQTMRQTDKQLACADIELEMNEAKYYIADAERNRGLSFGNVLKPWTYPSTYFSASKTVNSANDRIRYLSDVYKIRKCGGDEANVANAAPVQPNPQPPMMQGYQPAQPVMPVYQAPYGYAPMMPPAAAYAPTAMPLQAAPVATMQPVGYGLDYKPVSYGTIQPVMGWNPGVQSQSY